MITQHTRFLFLTGITFVTAMALLWFMIIHITFARAATPQATCASTRGTQTSLCEQQDPIAQGCVQDAQTLDLHTVFLNNQQTKPLGEVELRYSPRCHTYWVRTTAFLSAKNIFQTIHAILLFHNHHREDIARTPLFPDPRFPYVVWTDMTCAPLLVHAGSGQFSYIQEPLALTIALKG